MTFFLLNRVGPNKVKAIPGKVINKIPHKVLRGWGIAISAESLSLRPVLNRHSAINHLYF